MDSVVAFFEGNYDLSESLEIWDNIRYTHDDKSIVFSQDWGDIPEACEVACDEIFGLVLGLNPIFGTSVTRSFENVSPGAGINFRFSEDKMTYAKLVAFVDNAADNRYTNFESKEDRHTGFYAPGRTYGLQAVYNFNKAPFRLMYMHRFGATPVAPFLTSRSYYDKQIEGNKWQSSDQSFKKLE